MSDKKETAKKATETATEPAKQDSGVNGSTGAKKATTTATKPETLVYIGPNLLSDGLKKNTVFRGRPTDIIELMSDKYANISRLFVRVENLSRAMIDVEKAGTPLNLAYTEIIKSTEVND